MDVLMQSNQQYLNMLGSNYPSSDKPHRFLKYLMFFDINDGKAIYNEMTRSFVWLPYPQFDSLFRDETSIYADFMWKNYFIVNEDFDERKVVDEIRNSLRSKYDDPNFVKSGTIKQYTIITTTGCNARCFYCYEKGLEQKPMTSQTARKVGEYIVSTARKNGEQIELRWFGGEPLVNENAIDIICKIVQDAGYSYRSSITTNGFLFKQEKLEKYRELWHLVDGQITLDGTEEVYNKAKNYKNVKGKSPYQIVMNNIKMMLEFGMKICIRMNIDSYNYENIKDLIRELHEKFGNIDLLNLYCYPIFEDPEKPRTNKELDELYGHLDELDNLLKDYGYFIGQPIDGHMRIYHCMVDAGDSVLFDTEGNIGLCEHYLDSHFWGNINNKEEKNLEEIKLFKEYDDDNLEICNDCPMYPSCTRLKMCADIRACEINKKKWNIKHHLEGIKMLYDEIIRNAQMENQQQEQCQNQECEQNCNCEIKKEDNEYVKYIEDNKKNSFWDRLKIKFNMK